MSGEENDKGGKTKNASLSDRIAQFEAKTTNKQSKRRSAQMPAAGMALAGRVATELVAGIALGAFVGWLIDRWLGTTPAFMLVLFFLGAAGGMMNVWRLLTGQGMNAGYFGSEQNKKNVDEAAKDSETKTTYLDK